MGVSREISEIALNHTLKGMEAIYDGREEFPERRQALAMWADFLIACETGTSSPPGIQAHDQQYHPVQKIRRDPRMNPTLEFFPSSEACIIGSDKTRQGYVRKHILKPAGYSFLAHKTAISTRMDLQ